MRVLAQKTPDATSAKSATTRRAQPRQGTPVSPVHELQRTMGNRALQRMLQANTLAREDARGADESKTGAAFGLKPAADEGEPVFGRSAGEFVGDVARPVGTAVGNLVGGIAGAVTGISISSSTASAANWTHPGEFDWRVGFSTTGRSGWIVQELDLDWRGSDAGGTNVGSPHFPHFFEAWSVDAAGTVAPSVGSANDFWQVPAANVLPAPFNTAVEGHWSATASVHFTTVDPATQGFIRNHPNTHSGILLSSTAAPGPLNLGIARLHRYAQGT